MAEWKLGNTFDTGRGRVRWDAFGSGPPLVLLHGTPFSSYVWRDIAGALSAHRRVYVWDMLGYGTSEQAEDQDVSLRAQARVFAALLAHWKLPEPDVVGHDFGGAVALRALLLEGAAYRSLALADAVALAPWGTGLYRLIHRNPEVFGALPAAHHEALVRTQVRTAAHRPLPEDTLDALVAPWLGAAGQAAFYRQIAQNDQRYTDEIEPSYASLDVPLRILWGERDEWIPPAQGRKLAARTGAEFRLVPGAGHLVQEDAPARLAVELASWLRG